MRGKSRVFHSREKFLFEKKAFFSGVNGARHVRIVERIRVYPESVRFMKQAALVLQGGGARGIYVAGVLDALMEEGFVFPFVYGTSAGALCATGLLSNQIGRNKEVVLRGMPNKRFASMKNFLKTKNFFDFDWLFHEFSRNELPFDEEAFWNSPIDFYAAATGFKDGKVHYFRKKDFPDVASFYPAIAASSSLPLIAKPVEVNGELYLDGGPVCAIPYRKPIEDGHEKIVVVSTRDLAYRKKPMKGSKARLGKWMYRKHPEFLKAYLGTNEEYNRELIEIEELEKKGRIFVIRPSVALSIKATTKDVEVLSAAYELGKQDCLKRLEGLRRYLSDE